MKNLIASVLVVFVTNVSMGQEMKKDPKPEWSLVFGLTQPLFTNGFNFEVDYWAEKWMMDYSHGLGLEFTGDLVIAEAQRQQLAFNVSHSIGFGFGYRFTKGLNLRLEPKWHIWEVYFNDAFKSQEGFIDRYSTYTLGLGLYYRWTPFEKQNNALKGLTIAPNARWWPNIATTLDNNELAYFNSRTGQNEIHQANNIGMGNTPFFVNVSIGYTFGLK